MESDATYLARRGKDERVAAMAAAHPAARQAHLAMANRYDEFARAIDQRERYLGISSVAAS